MFTRRQALLGAAAASLIVAMPPAVAGSAAATPATEAEIASLPRRKVTLVAPPFAHEHEQVATTGPQVVEFTMPIVEKKIVIDEEGTEF